MKIISQIDFEAAMSYCFEGAKPQIAFSTEEGPTWIENIGKPMKVNIEYRDYVALKQLNVEITTAY